MPVVEREVVAQSEEHLQLLADGWKPVCAYQLFKHLEKQEKGGFFLAGKGDDMVGLSVPPGIYHDLKPVSQVIVSMAREAKSDCQ